MANHKSSIKRIRQSAKLRVHNKYYAKTMRNAVKALRDSSEKEEATAMYPKVISIIDRVAKKNIIHKNKASNLKSSLAAHVNSL